MSDKVFPEIGVVHFNKKKGCRRVIIKVKNDSEVYVSMPWLCPQKKAEEFVLSRLGQIKIMQGKRKSDMKFITQSQEKFTHFHNLEIVTGIDNSLRISVKNDVIKVIIPQTIPIESPQIQEVLITTVEKVLKKEAQEYLVQRIEFLAQQRGFTYSNVKISSAKTRWGCCNTQKRIIFSQYLMTLPFHLIDYVILHELCHTIYMNHSKDFYALLDKCCDGNLSKYKSEMRQCSMDVFPKFSKEDFYTN